MKIGATFQTTVSWLHSLKPNGLRTHLTVLRWLLDTNQVKVDESLKEEMAGLERIQSYLTN